MTDALRLSVTDYDLRNASDVPKTVFQRIQEVIHSLRYDGHRKAIVRCVERLHKDLILHPLAGLEFDLRHRVSGKDDEKVLFTLVVRRYHKGRILLFLCDLLIITIKMWIFFSKYYVLK